MEVDATAWGGIFALVQQFISTNGLAIDYPTNCSDGRGPIATDDQTLGLAIRGEISELEWPMSPHSVPQTGAVMDLLEFCHAHVAETSEGSFHSFFDHSHLTFNRAEGQRLFRERANQILLRNKLAYELKENGTVSRLVAPVFGETLYSQNFHTGDPKLDQLLESARVKFLDRDSIVRRDSLEKLWDAWERIKTIEPGVDKKMSITALLNNAATESKFREHLENEANTLTIIGNTFHIRHSEMSQVEIQTDDQVDYLFYRLLALIWLLIRAK
jgi:hypothetical protein